MSIVYGIKSEKKYLGGMFASDTAPILEIQYKTGIEFPLVSVTDFYSWFGSKNTHDIGILCDFAEYINDDLIGSREKIISVKPSENVNPKVLQLDPKYKYIFGKQGSKTFKCLPVSTPLRSHRSLNVYVTSQIKGEVVKEILVSDLRKIILGLTFTTLYNDITYDINVPITSDSSDSKPTAMITCKIHDIGLSGILAEQTNFWIKGSDNISIISEAAYNRNMERKLLFPRENSLVPVPIKQLELNDVILETKPTPLSFDFSKLKVGGLRRQLQEISNVIRPRGINKEYLEKIGMDEFEKGIILYGPPGTGKTTIARELSHILGVKQFIVVNGPELLTKYVGESEANVRRVLENHSHDLKVVFFDEFDCLAKERTGGDGPGSQVANNIVNQILAIMDGVEQKNNILIIAATNRIDVIDPALLRPGRFGLSLYIGLPEKTAREDIFKIHLVKNINNATLSKDVSLTWLADHTENYSGAEIKGICKKAREIALAEAAPDLSNLTDIDTDLLNLEMKHFEIAFDQIKCSFAGNGSNASQLLPSGDGDTEAIEAMSKSFNETKVSPRIHTYLLSGVGWSRKSSSSCRVICEKFKDSFEMILIITNNLINELNKVDLTTGKSILIILDNLENLCGILNTSSYNPKAIEKLNQFVGNVVIGKVVLIATMRTSAYSIFSVINPIFEWNMHTTI